MTFGIIQNWITSIVDLIVSLNVEIYVYSDILSTFKNDSHPMPIGWKFSSILE